MTPLCSIPGCSKPRLARGRGHEGCVAPAHLRWATRSENEADKLLHGTHTRGELNGRAKLTEADVIAIRSMAGTVSQRDISKRLGVSESIISSIIRGKSWRELSAANVALTDHLEEQGEAV